VVLSAFDYPGKDEAAIGELDEKLVFSGADWLSRDHQFS
jgi:hypothetical protein